MTDDKKESMTEKIQRLLDANKKPAIHKNVYITLFFDDPWDVQDEISAALSNFREELKSIKGFRSAWSEIMEEGAKPEGTARQSLNEMAYEKGRSKGGDSTSKLFKPAEDAARAIWDAWPDRSRRGEKAKYKKVMTEKYKVDDRTVQGWLKKWKGER